MQQSNILLHYRNGVYQGQVKSGRRHGKGIMIIDQGEIVVGTWKNDKLYGNVLMLMNQGEYCYGQFNRGQLQGWSKFQSGDKILVSQFNASRPINKQLLIDKNELSYKVTTLLQSTFSVIAKGSIFESVKQHQVPQPLILQQLIDKQLNINYPSHVNYTLTEYLTECYKNDECFESQVLMNGYLMFRLKDSSSVVDLGFVVNKNNQLVSYGSYINSKLNGLGCKFENSVRYEGIFQNGFLNGQGLKCAAGKYSFGTFQNGTLTQPVYLQERSLASEQKLKQLKKLTHMSHLNFANIYLPQNMFKFKGTQQIVFQVSLKQQYLLTKPILASSPSKKPINLGAMLLNNRQQPQIKSSISLMSKAKPNRIPNNEDSRVSDTGKSVSVANSMSRFRN